MAPPLSKEQVKILEDQFRKDEYIRGEEVMRQLVKATGLRADQIRTWFSRERGKRKRGEENDELEKKIADKDAEIRGLRDQIAALQVQNAAEIAALQYQIAALRGQLERQQTHPTLDGFRAAWSPDGTYSWGHI